MFPCVVFFILLFGNGFCGNHTTYEKFVTLEKFITQHKYPYENHTVLTEDGYYLSMGRIPVILNKTCEKIKGTVVLYHGMLNNGMAFFYLGPGPSLGFELSDKCYDVWIANTRGTRFSSRHVNLTIHDRAFWNFSFDELAKYDTKAIFDYVLNATGSPKIQFIAFSQATTQILMFLSENPSYENKTASLQLVAPIVYMDDFAEYPKNLPKEFLHTLTKLTPDFFARPLPDYDYLFHDVLYKLCNAEDGAALCSLFTLSKFTHLEEDVESNLKWASNFPERVSFKTLAHYGQIHMDRVFQMYDYGPAQNLQRYGTEKPPRYHVENITSPIHLYVADGDTYSTKQSVDRLSNQLTSLKLKYHIENPVWGHSDYFKMPKKGAANFRQKLLESLTQYEQMS